MRKYLGALLIGFAGMGLALVVVGNARTADAQQRPPSLPTDCASGQIVVSQGGGRFACQPAQEALSLAHCSEGDFVVADHFDRLRCQHPSSSGSSGSRGQLPACSSGEVLVSEGSGSWRCRSSALPSCSSGEILVSQGSGSWRCDRR